MQQLVSYIVRFGLFVFGLLLWVTGPVLRRMEDNAIAKDASSPTTEFEPVFIVGPPRSGTTFLYQALTSQLECAYFNNLSHLLSPFVYLAAKLGHHILPSAHTSFDSHYGATLSGGLAAPSEMGPFWRRLLGDSFDHSPEPAEQDRLRRIFYAIMAQSQSPLLVKNLPAARRIDDLLAAFPNARFILCKRDPILTLQSILRAREIFNVPPQSFWSVTPIEPPSRDFSSDVELVAYQIRSIEDHIETALKDRPEQLAIVRYETFCTDLENETRRLAQFCNCATRSEPTPSSSQSLAIHLSEEQLQEAQAYFALDWIEFRDSVNTPRK